MSAAAEGLSWLIKKSDELAKKFKTSVLDESSTFGEGAKRKIYTDEETGGSIHVLEKADGKQSVLQLEVPEEHRRKGIGKALQQYAMKENPNLQGQVSSKHAAKSAYDLGRRPYGKANATLEDTYAAIDDMSSVNMVSPSFMKSLEKPKLKGWHGTPHDFPPTESNPLGAFDMSKMGSGEGVQAYGYGHYLGEARKTGEAYRGQLAKKELIKEFEENAYLLQDASHEEVFDAIADGHFSEENSSILKELMNEDWLGFDYPSQGINAAFSPQRDRWDVSDKLTGMLDKKGSLYEVDIDASLDEMMNWDLPLNQQSSNIKEKFKKATDSIYDRGYGQTATDLIDDSQKMEHIYHDLGTYGKMKPQGVSSLLDEHGIKGIQFDDGWSRGLGKESGTKNYVAFSDKILSIAKKYGIAPAAVTTAMVQEEEAQAALNQMQFEIPEQTMTNRPENQARGQEPKTFTEMTDDLIADGLSGMGLNKHRAAGNAEILNMIAGLTGTLGSIQLGSDVGHYARKAKDYYDNNYLFGNPLFKE